MPTNPYPINTRVQSPASSTLNAPLASRRIVSGIPGASIPSSPTPITPARNR